MTMADTVPTLPAALLPREEKSRGPKVTPGIPPEAVPPFRLGRGHLQFSLVPVRGRFISAQRYGYCINSPGAGDDFWGSAHSKSSPTIARRALCVVTKSPIEPHSPLIRNNKFKTAANDRRAKATSDEPGIACSSLRLAAFKICWYTFCLMASSVIISPSEK